jgi:hypothetical protein
MAYLRVDFPQPFFDWSCRPFLKECIPAPFAKIENQFTPKEHQRTGFLLFVLRGRFFLFRFFFVSVNNCEPNKKYQSIQSKKELLAVCHLKSNSGPLHLWTNSSFCW